MLGNFEMGEGVLDSLALLGVHQLACFMQEWLNVFEDTEIPRGSPNRT